MMLQLGILLFAVSCSSEFATDSTTNTRGRITPPDTNTETNGLNEGDEDSPNSGGEIEYETFQPNVQITSTSSNPTNNGLIDVTVTFSESVSEFTEADLKVTGGIVSNFTGTGNTYNFNLTPTGVGNLTVNIEPGVAKDSDGHSNIGARQFSIDFDNIPPDSPSFSIANDASYTNSSIVNLTMAVNGATQMYITNTPGCPSGGSWEPLTETKSWAMSQINAAATVYIVFRDDAGNITPCISDSIIHDDVRPTVSLAGLPSTQTTTSAYDIDITTDSGVDTYKYAIVMDSISCTAPTYSSEWISHTTNITGNLSSMATWKICVIGRDPAGNYQVAAHATEYTWQYEDPRPAVSITSTSNSQTNDNPITAAITFNQNVTGFTIGDINVNGATAANFTGSGSSYSIELTPTSNGTITVNISADAAVNSTSETNTASNQFTIEYDNIAPSAPSLNIAGGTSHVSSAAPTLTISAIGATEMYLTNTAACTAGGSWEGFATAKAWTLAQMNATNTVYIKFRDNAGNETSCVNDSIIHDNINPVTVLDNKPSSLTSDPSYDFDVLPDDGVLAYKYSVISSLSLCGEATYGNTWINHNTNITGNVSGNGTWKICVTGQDEAGNSQLAASATEYIWQYNSGQSKLYAPPDLEGTMIIAAGATYSNITNVSINLEASQATEIYLTNNPGCAGGGSWQPFSQTKGWTLAQTNSTATVYGKFRSSSGNESLCISDSIIHDSTRPTVTINSSQTIESAAGADRIMLNVLFSEPVSGFSINDIQVSGGTKEAFAGSADSYTFEIIAASGTVTTYIPMDLTTDEAGNGNQGGGHWNIEIGSLPIDCSGLNGGNWVGIPGNTNYGTDRFCVMKYEAKEESSFPVSRPNDAPWTSISQADAVSACQSLGPGYDLISNQQWMTIAENIAHVDGNWSNGTVGQGSLSRGHADDSPNQGLGATIDDDHGCIYTGQECSGSSWDAQRRTGVLSNGEVIWDLTGNAEEWVNYNQASGKAEPSHSDRVEYTDVTGGSVTWKQDLIPSNHVNNSWWDDSWNTNQGIGSYQSSSTSPLGVLSRGGSWTDGGHAGLFNANFSHNENTTHNMIGFRCTSRVPGYIDTEKPSVIINPAEGQSSNNIIRLNITFSESVSGFNLDDIVVTNGNKANLKANGSQYRYQLEITDQQGDITVDIANDIAHDSVGNGNTAAITWTDK